MLTDVVWIPRGISISFPEDSSTYTGVSETSPPKIFLKKTHFLRCTKVQHSVLFASKMLLNQNESMWRRPLLCVCVSVRTCTRKKLIISVGAEQGGQIKALSRIRRPIQTHLNGAGESDNLMNKAHPHLEPSDNGRRNRHNRQIYSFIVFNLKLSYPHWEGALPQCCLILIILLSLRANNYILAEGAHGMHVRTWSKGYEWIIIYS